MKLEREVYLNNTEIFYNRQRAHSFLEYLSPEEYEEIRETNCMSSYPTKKGGNITILS